MARIMLFVFGLSAVCAAQSNEPKRVLILSQEDLTWPAYRLIDENARAALRAGSPEGILIFSEHLDRVHFPDPQFQEQQEAWIQRKYADANLDLVIGVADVPTHIFPGVPVLHVGTDPLNKRPSPSAATKDVTTIWIELDALRTLEAARRLQPQARQVVVIGSSSTTGRNLLDQVRDQISGDPNHLPVTYLTNLKLQEIYEKVATLGPESIVLYVSFARDVEGRQFISTEVMSKINAVSKAPVYVVLETNVGLGAVGGYVTSFDDLGKQAGEMGLQLLAGNHPEDAVARSEYIFDWRQLQRWKISESALPAGSVLLFRQQTIWQSYKWYILAAILLSFLETLLLLGLLRQRRAKRKVEASLIERLTFEKLLSDLSTKFISLPENQIDVNIEQGLGRIAEVLEMDRVTLFEFSADRTVLKSAFSWVRGGVTPAPTSVKAADLPWWRGRLASGEVAFVTDRDSLPEEALAEREYFRQMGILSAGTVPLRVGGEIEGAISFVSSKRRVTWTEDLLNRVRVLGEVFWNALMRKRAQEALVQHAAIVESSDDAIISRNLDGIIMSWNAGAERLFEFRKAEVIGRSIRMIIPDELEGEESELLERLRAGEHIEHYETVRRTKSGKKIDVSLTISPVKNSAGVVVGASKIARDITEGKRAERVLRESEERFRLVANSAPVLIWMSGTDKLCTFFNQGWLSFTGRSMEEELGEGWVIGVHPEDVQRCLRTYFASFDARAPFEMEYRLRRFDGEFRWVVDYGTPRFEMDGTFCGYIGSAVDITERKTSEESLHSLSGRLIHAQEEERARIARELHDDFSQRLALLGISLGQLWKDLPESQADQRTGVLEILKGTKEMSSDLHSLSHQLHSSKLELVGLVSALSGLCQEMGEKYKIEIHFTKSGVLPKITKEVELCLFRVTQEALGNVVKHSQSKRARVELGANSMGVSLRIADEGRGFEPDLSNPAAGIGLVGMRERLRLVGGRLSVKSELLRGTEVLAEVPLADSANEMRLRARTM
jgi:PAS domain S-box-containing protein